jgi:hypothetical protein
MKAWQSALPTSTHWSKWAKWIVREDGWGEDNGGVSHSGGDDDDDEDDGHADDEKDMSMVFKRGWCVTLCRSDTQTETKRGGGDAGLASALIHGKRFGGGGRGPDNDTWMLFALFTDIWTKTEGEDAASQFENGGYLEGSPSNTAVAKETGALMMVRQGSGKGNSLKNCGRSGQGSRAPGFKLLLTWPMLDWERSMKRDG